MPEADIDIFTLSGDAQYEGKWRGIDILRANAGADIAVNVEATAEFCHGLQLSLGAEASAEAELALSMFLAIAGEVEAFAAAGANVKVVITPDIFDKFGFVGDIGAYAEASAATRLSIGLSIGQIRQAAEKILSDSPDMLPNQLALDIFNAFIDEIDIKAGVWGKASFAAMARGHLEIYGSLADPKKSGFVFELGGSVGLSAGTGWDFFAVAGINNPERFYTRTTDLITTEVITIARDKLPVEYYPVIELVDFCLPAVFQLTMVAGQATANAIVTNPESIAEPVVEALTKSFQRYVLRKLINAGQMLIEELINDMIEFITKDYLSDDQREQAKTKIEDFIGWLQDNAELDLDSFIEFSSQLTDFMVILLPDEVETWREPLAVMWCGLAITHVIDEIIEPISGSVSSVGFSVAGGLSEQDFELNNVPKIVLDEIEDSLGTRPTTLRLNTVVDYLSEGTIAPFIQEILPDLSILLELMEEHTGVTSGDFVSAILLGTVGGNIATSDLYKKFRSVLHSAIDGYIDKELLPDLKNVIPKNSQTHLYIEEVVEPSLLGCSNFVFNRLDGMIAGSIDQLFVDSFRVGLSNLVYKVFARNVAVLGYLITNHVLNGLENEFKKLENDVKSDSEHLLVTFNSEAIKLLSFQLVTDATADKASQQLISDLLSIAQKAFGKQTWTQERRERLRKLLLTALVGDNLEIDYRNHTELDKFFTGMLECNHIPNADASSHIAALITEITLEQIMVLIHYLPPALISYQLVLANDILDQGIIKVKEAVEYIEKLAQDAWNNAEDFAKDVKRFVEAAKQATNNFASQLTKIETQFKSSNLRNKILDDIGKESTKDITTLLGAQDAAIFIYYHTIRQLIDIGLKAFGVIVGGLANVIEETLYASDLIRNVSFFIIEKIEKEIEKAFFIGHLDIPDWLVPIDDMASIASKVFMSNSNIISGVNTAYINKNKKIYALSQKNVYKGKEEKSRLVYRKNKNRLESIAGSNYSIKILSPLDLSNNKIIYEMFIPIEIIIKGVNATFFENNDFRRVFITINGTKIKYLPDQWKKTSKGFIYKGNFQSGQKPIIAGINILECNLIDTEGKKVLSHVSFIVDPKPWSRLLETIELGYSGDHIILENTSDQPINIEEWRIENMEGIILSLPNHTIMPREAIRILSDSTLAIGNDIVVDMDNDLLSNVGRSMFLLDSRNILRSIND